MEQGSVPLVSVVINFLNAEQFIEEAIESVFAQSYDSWELLLVDDGSTDASTEISRRCAEEHPEKVRYLEHEGHENRGASASRNLGSTSAKGEYIAFLDADDVWLPQKLQQQLAILQCHPEAEMVYGRAVYWYSWTESAGGTQTDFVQELGVQANTLLRPPKLLAALLQDEGATPFPSSILVRRSTNTRIGGWEETFRSIFDDQVYCAKLGLEAPVFASGDCWTFYRQHPNQRCAVTSRAGQYHSERLAFLNWLEEYLSGRGAPDGEVSQILQKELWPYRHQQLNRLLSLMRSLVKRTARRTLPVATRRWLRSLWRTRQHWPPVGYVRLGSLRRLKPISSAFGLDRGVPVNRYYIEQFLGRHSDDIQGHVLEIGDDTYTREFGGKQVSRSDVLHVQLGNPKATIVADLTCADVIASNTFDCIILTQTLQHIYDIRAALRHLHRILKPGGVLLATVPGISQISRHNMDRWGDYWRFTTLSARRLFEEAFRAKDVEVEAYGNVLAAVAFLHGLAASELRHKELEYHDPDYEVLITVRAVKPEAAL